MEKLGIELPQLITQIINFTILLVLLTKFLYKPVLKTLAERKRKIEEGLEYAEKTKQEQENIEKKRQQILAEAVDEGRKIIEEAKQDGQRAKEEIIKEGKREVNDLKEKTKIELKAKEQQLTEEVSRHIVTIAADMVKKLLPIILKDEDQHKIIVKNLQLIEKKHEQK